MLTVSPMLEPNNKPAHTDSSLAVYTASHCSLKSSPRCLKMAMGQ
jgi:hypothetical protein